MPNSPTANPPVKQHFPQRSSCPEGPAGARSVSPRCPERSTAPIAHSALPLHQGWAAPRTNQRFHNQGGKLQVIVSSDKETLQMPGPNEPGQLRFVSPPSEQRRSTGLRADPRPQPPAPHAPPPPEPGADPRPGEAAHPRHAPRGTHAAATRGPGPAGSGGGRAGAGAGAGAGGERLSAGGGRLATAGAG